MRQVNLEDKKLFKILEQRGETFKKIQDVNEQIVALDKDRNKLGYKMERLKEKTTDCLKNHTIELGEFEEIGSVGIEQGKIAVSIFDHIEEYKKVIREKKDENKRDNPE